MAKWQTTMVLFFCLCQVAVIPTINMIEFEVNSFIQGHHVYHSILQPKIGEELKVVMEPNNIADKYAVCIQENETSVGHLPKGKTGRSANTIFFFLRADEFNSCVAVVNGNRVNFRDGKGFFVFQDNLIIFTYT